MITVFYAKANSINPSYTILYDELSRRRESDLRVLDVSSLSEEEVGRYARASDLVVVDNFVRAAPDLDPAGLHSVTLGNWRGAEFYARAWEIASTAGAPLLYVASGWDLHWPGPDLERLLPRLSAIAWLFERRPVAREEVPPAYRDPWMEGHADPIENWEKVRSRVATRIELIHTISPYEFRPAAARPLWDVCIAGATYRPRVLADASAREAGLAIAPFRRADSAILRATARLPFFIGNFYASRLRNRVRQASQRLFTARSAINFVCGSGYRYPVRKFFEIPAVRSALLCYPCTGMRDYGFVAGEHYLEVAPEGFGREAKKLLAEPNRRERMIEKAAAMVRRLHSVGRRASDLIECMRRMRAGRLRVARFHEGEFVIE